MPAADRGLPPRRLAARLDRPGQWPGLGTRARSIASSSPDARRFRSPGPSARVGAAIALPERDRTIALRADGGDPARPSGTSWPIWPCTSGGGRAPRWFDEGYAGWAGGSGTGLGSDVNLAVARGAIPNFDALDGALRGGEATAEAAYASPTRAVPELARAESDRQPRRCWTVWRGRARVSTPRCWRRPG